MPVNPPRHPPCQSHSPPAGGCQNAEKPRSERARRHKGRQAGNWRQAEDTQPGLCYSTGFTQYLLPHITAPSASLFCSSAPSLISCWWNRVWFWCSVSVSPVLKCYSKMKRSFFRTIVSLNRLTVLPYLIFSDHWICSGRYDTTSSDDETVRVW